MKIALKLKKKQRKMILTVSWSPIGDVEDSLGGYGTTNTTWEATQSATNKT